MTISDLDEEQWVRRALSIATAVGVAAIVLLPFYAAARHYAEQVWFAPGDHGLIVLHSHDAAAGVQALGPYSRYGWNHPGPMLFEWLSHYVGDGDDDRDALVGTVALNAFAVAGSLWFGYRRLRLAGVVLVGTTLAILVHSLGVAFIADPWNPYAPVLPFALVVVLAWSAASGDVWAFPFLAVASSFVVQSHVGFALVTAAVAVWSVLAYLAVVVAPVVTAVIRGRRVREDTREWWRRLAIPWGAVVALSLSAVIVASLWAPVVAQQRSADGNLTKMLEFFGDQSKPTAGTDLASGIVSGEVALRAPWSGLPETTSPYDGQVQGSSMSVWWVLGMLLAAMVVTFLARRDKPTLVALQGTVFVAATAAIVAIAHTVDGVLGYLVRWTWVVGAFAWTAIAVAVLAAASRVPRLRWDLHGHRAVVLAGVGVTVVLSIGTTMSAGDAELPIADYSDAIRAMLGPTLAKVPPGQSVEVRADGGRFGQLDLGLGARLERAGRPVVVPPEKGYVWGDLRVGSRGTGPPTVLVVGEGDAVLDKLRKDPAWEELASYDRLTGDERRELFGLKLELLGAFARQAKADATPDGVLGDWSGIDPARRERFTDLQSRDLVTAVFRERPRPPARPRP